jgi:hypothetical protein
MNMETTSKIRSEIRKNGYFELESPTTGTYTGAIIACRKRGYAHVSICSPYGGSEHFAIESPEGGAWHTRGLDWEQAAKYCPAYGKSIASILDEVGDI